MRNLFGIRTAFKPCLLGSITVHNYSIYQTSIMSFLERISPVAQERKDADRLIARLQLQSDQNADEATLRRKLADEPDNLEARFDLAQALAANEKFEEALSEFLNIVKSDRSLRDDGARKAMVQIFEVLAPEDPLTEKYRSELAKVLFR